METFLVADWHIGEDRFDIMDRPFISVDDHIETLISNHNKVVSPDDEVYVIGDAVYNKRPDLLPVVARFNGKKTLIKGNHDRDFMDEDLLKYFVKVIPEGDGISREFNGIKCYLTHYPTQSSPDEFNLVGHIHSAWKVQLNMLNVGVDVHHFSPISTDKVNFYFNAIKNFYDEDVWVGYNPLNALYREYRGKKSRYYQR